jgi:hypothetical protein
MNSVPPTTNGAAMNVYDAGVLSIKQGMLDNFYMGLTTNPIIPKECSKYSELDCADSCEWSRGLCQPKVQVQWSGWTVKNLPRSVMFDGNFIDVEQIDGNGSPVLLKPGMMVRWSGADTTGKQETSANYVVEKVEQIGSDRRLWLVGSEQLNYYWGHPELQILV